MVLLLQYTLIFASVLILVALGGCFSEHSGVINLGLEGIMVLGALGGALVMRHFGTSLPNGALVLLTLLGAIAFGVVYSTLLGIASINFKADQTLVGTAMNLLGTAGATVIVKALNTAANPDDVSSAIQYAGPKNAFVLNIGRFEFNWFMLIAVLAIVFAYVLISGVLGGLGGICYILAGVSEWRFENGVAGFGFLSLAVMIFGQWKPTRIALAALLFGLFRALSNVYAGFGFLVSLNIPGPVYNMMPYIISLIVLAFTSKRSRAPKAEGIPYDKGQR